MSVVSQARNALGRAKGYGGCRRCGGTWDYTEEHTTKYDDRGAGCFPLCETCWVGLGTPEARMPYYESLIANWLDDAQRRGEQEHLNEIREKRPKIIAAVEAGL